MRKSIPMTLLIVSIFLPALLCSAVVGRTIYVDADATGAHNGSNWSDAYWCLQDALGYAQSGDLIRVAQGIYKPDRYVVRYPQIITSGDRMATFQLKNGVAVRGGYAGFGEPNPDRRDIDAYETILSGDLSGNDGQNFANNDENSYHVVTGSRTDETAVLGGCIITAGNANGSNPQDRGAGIHNDVGSPTLIACTFTGNIAEIGGGVCNEDNSSPTLIRCTFSQNSIYYDFDGAGMANLDNSSPTLSHCKFIGNMAPSGSGAGMYNYAGSSPSLSYCEFIGNFGLFAGGMFNYVSSNPTLSHCTFIDNSADLNIGGGMYNNNYSSPLLQHCTFKGNSSNNGGGMHNYFQSSPTLTHCKFIQNSASYGGGALYNRNNSNPTLTNCIFSGNLAEDGGGAMCNDGYCTPILTNCTFSQNFASEGNAMIFKHYYGGSGASNVQVANSILWDGGNEISNQDGSTITITYSDVQGSWPGEGNIDADPCFVKPGYWDPNGTPTDPSDDFWVDGDYHLQPDSPCIDAGDSSAVPATALTDFDGNPRIRGKAVDIGVYESPTVLFVDDDANGANNGSSWADAYNNLQDALTAAFNEDEIRVAQGVYKPDQGIGITPGDREATFGLINEVTIKGGYAGVSEPNLDARDIDAYETILSGDLNGDDVEVVEPCDLPDELSRAENSYTVVTSSQNDEASVLDGFTITAGNADGEDHWSGPRFYGGGMYNSQGRPTINNCRFIGNSANGAGGGMFNHYADSQITNCKFSRNSAEYGGGMDNGDGSWPTITNCTFSRNFSSWGGGMGNGDSQPKLFNCAFIGNISSYKGGGMANYDSSPPINNCTFIGNSAVLGGAIYGADCYPKMKNCTFTGNSAEKGGMMYNNDSSGKLDNCTLTANSAAFGGAIYNDEGSVRMTNCTLTANVGVLGGAIYNGEDSWLRLTNCTVSQNSAESGGVMFNEDDTDTRLINCILWADIPDEIVGYAEETEIIYSDIQGGWAGEGNTDADPCFVEPGYWDINGTPDDANDDFWIDGDYHLLADSPCINAGDPNYIPEPNETDLDGRPRIMGGQVDMGAYEFNYIPVAYAGEDQTLYVWFDEVAEVSLDGSGSYDDDGQPLTYLWRWTVDGNTMTATDSNLSIELPAGEYNIELIVSDGIDDSEPDEVVVTVVPPMETCLWVVPRVINRYSRQPKILALVRLAEGVTRDQIDRDRPLLLHPGGIEAVRQFVIQSRRQRAPHTSIFAFFDKAELMDAVDYNGRVELQLVGQLKTGQYFYGTDTVKVISPGRGHWRSRR